MDGIKAALQRQAEAAQKLSELQARVGGEALEVRTDKADFGSKLTEGLKEINQQIEQSDQLIDGIVTGKVTQFHEVAAQIKQADLSFKFTLAVRNKFVDAYREIMRMSV